MAAKGWPWWRWMHVASRRMRSQAIVGPDLPRSSNSGSQSVDVYAGIGTDRAYWHEKIGVFDPSSPLANEAGIGILTGSRDYHKVKRDLKDAGYRGEPIVVLGVSGNSYIVSISQVGFDQLRKAGMNVDLQIMDFGTLVRRRMSKLTDSKKCNHHSRLSQLA